MRQHILPAVGDRQLRQIKPSDVQTFVAGMERQGLSASRVRQAYYLLDDTLDAAVKDDRLARDPCVGIELPKLRRRKEGHIGAAQLAALAKASGSYRSLILLLGYSGMRWGEAVALRVRSIDFLGGKITVSESMAEVGGTLHFGTTKTSRTRTIRVPRAVLDLIEDQVTGKGPDDLVFTRV
jgi:integrase